MPSSFSKLSRRDQALSLFAGGVVVGIAAFAIYKRFLEASHKPAAAAAAFSAAAAGDVKSLLIALKQNGSTEEKDEASRRVFRMVPWSSESSTKKRLFAGRKHVCMHCRSKRSHCCIVSSHWSRGSALSAQQRELPLRTSTSLLFRHLALLLNPVYITSH